MGTEIGAGALEARTGPDFIMIRYQRQKDYWFTQDSLWVTHEAAPHLET
jgi:hypothetical protein